MFLWRKRATDRWLTENEEALRRRAGNRLTIIAPARRKRLIIEVVGNSDREGRSLMQEFGGHVEKVPRDWLQRLVRGQKRPPLRIGQRLVISNGEQAAVSRDLSRTALRHLVIPAGAAFGTGEHATTAMSLRLLERITRRFPRDWSFADLGTGSGILALAARRFGATHAIGVDNDPSAISTARANARFNKVTRIQFQIADVRSWRAKGRVNVVGANLYSELLVATLPRLRRYLAAQGWIILSGIMRAQERVVLQALRANGIKVQEIRRRGKWIALSGVGPGTPRI